MAPADDELSYDALITQLGHTLSQFQLIEQWMKAYIELALLIIRKKLPAEIAFRFSISDYEDAALGTLLSVFKKLNSNERLHADLAAIRKERDFIAHKATAYIDVPYSNNPENQALFDRLAALEKKANALFHRVGEEVDKLRDYNFENA